MRVLPLIVGLLLTTAALALDTQNSITHRVERGQTMARLARNYGITLEALRQANPDVDPQKMYVGTTLQIPAPLNGWPLRTLESGGMEQLGYPVEVLRQLNPGVDFERIQPGQTVYVPSAEPQAQAAAPAPPSSSPPPASAEPPVTPNPPGDWEQVTLADGRKAWAPRAVMMIPSLTPLAPDQVVDLAQKFMGVPYTWGGMSPNGVDCSGFVQEVFRLSGHRLPRLADEQFAQTSPIDEPQLGDLVFFTTYLPGPSHVGISLGGREFLHASSSRGVIRASLDDSYFKTRYLGARRIPPWAQAGSARVP